MQKITPHIWFDKQAEEAAEFYTSIFKEGKILNTTHYPEAGYEVHGMDAGTVLTAEFEIMGMKFIALNGGPHFKPNPSISFMVNFDPSVLENAKEKLDEIWKKISEGGKVLMPLDEYPFSKRYGWIEDKYGVSWQLILTDPQGEDRPMVVPSLLFVKEKSGKAKEAIDFYLSVFKDSKEGITAYFEESTGHNQRKGDVMFSDFKLLDQWFAAMDGGDPHNFDFNEGISLLVTCKDQEEIDYYWEKLSAVPESEQCGWLKDKYGVSWQIVPEGMEKMLNNPDKEKANRAMEAMLQMKKIDIAKLHQASE